MDKEGRIARPSLLALFPSPATSEWGGIQLSARVAWDAIRSSDRWQAHGVFLKSAPGRRVGVREKARAVVDVMGERADLTVVWHVALLKLLPFLKERGKVALYLHGIEAWSLTRSKIDWGQVDLFLTNSHYTWTRFLVAYPELSERPHRVVHLGLGSPTGRIRTPDPIPTAVCISRLEKSENYKGHRELIQAWPALSGSINSPALEIVGEGDLKADLEAEVRELGLSQQVSFHGWVSAEEKDELLLRSRCLALPSRAEGFGLVYLEAMRLGRPCLVSSVDAGREVVDPPTAGLAVDPDIVGDIVSALTRLMSDGPDWNELSAKAKQRYDTSFTEEHFKTRLLQALQEAVG